MPFAPGSRVRPSLRTSPLSGEAGHRQLIDLRKVVKTYASTAGSFTALKRVDLQVDHGEFVTVIGKSGSGKTTLINCRWIRVRGGHDEGVRDEIPG